MSYELATGPAERWAALRIIDANANRAAEGLRAVEDYCRFVLDDRHLTERIKWLRHVLAESLEPVEGCERAAARDTPGDVGTTITTAAGSSRPSLDQIASANSERVKQALRAIEEYAKLAFPEVASRVEALRYQWYMLEKAWCTTAESRERLAAARLYVLIDGGPSECAYVERVQELIAAGVHALQLRDKRLDDRTLVTRARLLRRVMEEGSGFRDQGSAERGQRSEVRGQKSEIGRQEADHSPLIPHHSLPLLIINDRPDIAVLARADGVHVGQEELPVADVRKIVGPEMLIGVSTHTIEQARQAVLDGANYIGCGPTFPSGTKRFDHFPGLAFLRQVAAEISLPAFAIGGITWQNLGEVLAAGFSRIAVGAALSAEEDVAAAARCFLTMLESRD
jgi:thiamine-phosphate pyrophosphorylase